MLVRPLVSRRRLLVLGAALPFAGQPRRAAAQATPVTPIRADDAPVPVAFPRDDGPHDVLIEWWYYTGHLSTDDNTLYGFEYVVFKGKQDALEGAVSHFSITDNAAGRFIYEQRIQGIAGVLGDAAAMDLSVGNWRMVGEDGEDRLRAVMDDEQYGIDLRLSSSKPPVLHDGDGYIAYGNGTASYYYSRTRIDVEGRLRAGDATGPVTGAAWMDHQWGDFQTYASGGWDWFAVQLEDGRDVMLYLIRNLAGEVVLVDGSIVAADGEATILGAGDFELAAIGEWTSPTTGTTYPSGWTIALPAQRLEFSVVPTMPDQELDTRETTGVIYWEGQAIVGGTSNGEPIAGLAYVELTGYAPVEPLTPEVLLPAATPSGG